MSQEPRYFRLRWTDGTLEIARVWGTEGEFDTSFWGTWTSVERQFIEGIDEQIPALRALLLLGSNFFKEREE